MNTLKSKITGKSKTSAPKKAKGSAREKTAFLNTREKSALEVNFHETKLQRLGDKYLARQVKNLANQCSRLESTEKKIVSATSVINDFRQGKFSAERLTDRRVKSYASALKRASGGSIEFTRADVERDLMRQASAIWKRGSF